MSRVTKGLYVGGLDQANELFNPSLDRIYDDDYEEVENLEDDDNDNTEDSRKDIGGVISVSDNVPYWCYFNPESTNNTVNYELLDVLLSKYTDFSYFNLHIDSVKIKTEDGFREAQVLHSIIHASDSTYEPIFKAFHFTFDFIEGIILQEKSVFVHCTYGMSRSTTLVCSYLMKKWNKRFKHVKEYMKHVHPITDPNSGFIRQLNLYYKSNFVIKSFDSFWNTYRNSINNYQQSSDVEESEDAESIDFVYSCKICRRILFSNVDVVNHKSRNKGECSSLFVEPMDWMVDLELQKGKLACRGCSSKLGSFSWHGRNCSCGHIETPGIQIQASKVDKIPYDPELYQNIPNRHVNYV